MKYLPKIVLSLILVAGGGAGILKVSQARNAANPQQIIEKMTKTYGEARSYRDSGTVATQYRSVKTEGAFTTTFIRPNRYRFEFKGTMYNIPINVIVWKKDNDIYTWQSRVHSPNRTTKELSLSLATAKATGISGGAASDLPNLLLPQEIGEGSITLTDLTKTQRLSDEKLGGVECFRIQGVLVLEGVRTLPEIQTTLWLGQNDFLVRKIESKQGEWSRTVTYQPELNGEIEDKSLSFNTP